MGWGDELIAAGQARRMQQEKPGKVLIRDLRGNIRKHDMWANNPRIVGPAENAYKAQELLNGPGARPYIAAKTDERWTWKDFECLAGEIYFSAEELAFAAAHAPAVVIEPNNKQQASPNKQWGRERWVALAALLRAEGIAPVQLGPVGTQLVPGAQLIETPSFRHACAVLGRAKAAVLPEGGLHHAAAALGVKAVVIFGGFISPRQTGYAFHVNLFTGGEACGMRVPCAHCAAAMAQIAPEAVMTELRKLLA